MKKKVHAYVHTHWDREWYREFEEFRLRLDEVFNDILSKLSSGELDTFYFDGQTLALEDYLQIYPEKANKIKELIKEKKLFIGPYYCSTDSFLIDRESLIKNLQIGIEYSKKLGCSDFIAYHADTFGHSYHIPQIIKYFDIKNAMFWRGVGEVNAEFLYNGLKSTNLVQGYFHDYFSIDASYEQKAKMLTTTLDKIAKFSKNDILLPIGADHLAVPENLKEQIKEVNKHLKDYEILLSTPFEYLKKVDNNYKMEINKELRETTRNFILPGVFSSRIDLKQQNSKLQWMLSRVVQPIQAVGVFLGKTNNFQKEVDYTYKQLINNHPHDSIYGCSTDNVHRANKIRYESVSASCNAILNSVKRDLYSENVLSAINLSNFDFKGALKIKTDKKLPKEYNAQLISKTKGFPLKKVYDITQIPITEDYTDIYEYLVDVKRVPVFSAQNITAQNIEKKSSLKITENSVENDKIALTVKSGKIVLTDKVKNKKYNDFIKFIDRADIGDSYNFGALKSDKPITSKILKTKIKEKGQIRSILEIIVQVDIPVSSSAEGRKHSTKKHILSLQAILENQNDYIEFVTEWENKSTNHILQVEFNMETPITETISDDLAGHIKRDFDPNYDVYKLLPAPRGIELKLNTAPLQKYLLIQGSGFITEGLQEYEIYKNKLRLTLLRATGTISTPKNPCRGTPAGPPLPTPDLQMLGKNSARFAVCFTNSTELLEKYTEKFYGATLLIEANLQQQTLFETNNKNIIVSTIKTNDNNNLIIRLLNKADKPQQFMPKFNLPHKKVWLTDAMEQKTKEFAPTKIEANSFITVMIEK